MSDAQGREGLESRPSGPKPGARVSSVPDSLRGLIEPGESIVKVDGETIEDTLDFHFYCSFAEKPILTVLDTEGNERELRLESEDSGIEFEPLEFKKCGNDCVFCFIHQMPTGMREELYLQDEDYRLGFMFGNYVTLALAREGELDRIVRQHLSPQYVSVHATEMGLRNRLLGLKRSRDILQTLRRLIDGGVTVHAQVVLLPGWNDGPALDRTLGELSKLWPDVESLGIVPVGLTDHRGNLPKLEAYGPEGAREVLDQVGYFQASFLSENGSRFAHLADEFYLLAGRPLPQMDEYEDFPQMDNGIGMARDFVETGIDEAAAWKAPKRALSVLLLTGKLGARLIEEYLRETLDGLEGLQIEVRALENRLFGAGVTVSGLLPGRELLKAALEGADGRDLVILPPNTLNAADLFLDDISLESFRQEMPIPVVLPETGLLGPLAEFTDL